MLLFFAYPTDAAQFYGMCTSPSEVQVERGTIKWGDTLQSMY